MPLERFLGRALADAMAGASFDLADAGGAGRIEQLAALVANAEARVAEARASFAAAADLADRVGCGHEPVSEAMRRAAIEVLLGIENSHVGTARLWAERTSLDEHRAARAAPHLLVLLRRMAALLAEAARLHAQAVRDMRWALLEREAAASPPADGPVLASPADVASFLQGLRAAT